MSDIRAVSIASQIFEWICITYTAKDLEIFSENVRAAHRLPIVVEIMYKIVNCGDRSLARAPKQWQHLPRNIALAHSTSLNVMRWRDEHPEQVPNSDMEAIVEGEMDVAYHSLVDFLHIADRHCSLPSMARIRPWLGITFQKYKEAHDAENARRESKGQGKGSTPII